MTIDDVRFLLEYDRWANTRVFEAVNALTEEQFTRVRETLAHIVGVEWLWLQRVIGSSPKSAPEWMENATRESLHGRLGTIESDWRDFVKPLTDDDLDRRVEFVRLNGEAGARRLGHILQHVVNHSTYHRGQVAMLVRQAGGVPLETDLFDFTADR